MKKIIIPTRGNPENHLIVSLEVFHGNRLNKCCGCLSSLLIK